MLRSSSVEFTGQYSNLYPTQREAVMIEKMRSVIQATGATIEGISYFDTNTYDVQTLGQLIHIEQLTRDTTIPIPKGITLRAKTIHGAFGPFNASLLLTRQDIASGAIFYEAVGLIHCPPEEIRLGSGAMDTKPRCVWISFGEWGIDGTINE